jgi:HlyD family secretion protein
MPDSNADKADLSALKIDRNRKSNIPGRRKRWFHLLWLLLPMVIYLVYQRVVLEVTPSVRVQTAPVRFVTGSEASSELVATGYVVAQVKADVASKGTGRLRKLNVEEGDSVKKGDIIAELDNDDIRAELDLARANLKGVRADSLEAELNYTRQKKLLEAGHTTQEAFDAATAAYRRAGANVEAMAASVKAAEVAMENTVIRAPFDGTVLTKHADVGEMVAPFASASSSRGAVVTLADMKSLQVEADVSESNIQKVKINQPCEIILDAYPGQKYSGYVGKIVPTADRSRATVMTKISFDNIDAQVLPEMSARVNFLSVGKPPKEETKPTLAIPKSALTMRGEQSVVFTIKDGIAWETPVQTGRQLGDVTEILSGLKAGDSVILSPAGGLKSGDKIEISN